MPRSPSRIDRARLSPQWPTDLFPSAFWEQLGRTIATFGLLEDVLGKAIFAFTATTEFNEKDAAEYLAKWDKQLHQALTDTLWPLSEVYGKVVREHQASDFKNVDCPGRCKSEPPCRPNSEPGMEAGSESSPAVDEFMSMG